MSSSVNCAAHMWVGFGPLGAIRSQAKPGDVPEGVEMCDVDDEMGRAEIAMAGYSVNCSVKPARDGVKSREGGGAESCCALPR